MYRALRSMLVVVSLFAVASFASACANSPTDITQADGYANNNCPGCSSAPGNGNGGDGGGD